MVCPKCGSKDVGPDGNSTICFSCGNEIEDNCITSGLEFSNQAPHGQFLNFAGRALQTASGFTSGSREQNLFKTQREIQRIGTNMNIEMYHIQAAQRLYKLIQERDFVKGHKKCYVIPACLYIAWRQNKTAHLLIDFSDHIGIDLYKLGTTVRKIIRTQYLKKELPIWDPSLFIYRFCNKLNFGTKNAAVALTAIRLVKSMKRDWMSCGRRPNGICGAAILIAARYHGFKRSTQQIMDAVKVGSDTIRKRLEEFQNTPIASLTRHEFETKDLEEAFEEQDPPAFTRAQLEAEKGELKLLENVEANLMLSFGNDNSGEISDIDDSEIANYILTLEETDLKSKIWHQENGEWLQKKLIRDEEKPTPVKTESNLLAQPTTPITALQSAFSSQTRIKMDAIQSTFDRNVESTPIIKLTKD